jgi:anti-sigma factor RsiW
MSSRRRDLPAVLALRYVLGLLTPAVRRRYEQLLQDRPELEQRTQEIRSRVTEWLESLRPGRPGMHGERRLRIKRTGHPGGYH